MISKQLKAHFHTGEPVVQEFGALMKATFRYYAQTHTEFFEKFPSHLLQSELVSFINVDLKNRLFTQSFCETIPDALKSLRRVIIRLEDLRRGEPAIPPVVHDLARLTALAERVEALYQLHWEFYRYQAHLNEEELVGFLLEIDNIGKAWDIFQENHATVQALLATLRGNGCPEKMAPLAVAYQREPPDHFAVGTLRTLVQFLEAAYRFACAVKEIDPTAQPLSLLQVEVANPVELLLAVPEELEEPFRKMLHYLFLKDLLKRETLLKFVFEAIQREFGAGKSFSAAALTGFQKDLSAPLKHLPADGRFTVSDRTFPRDGIRVLQEFTGSLEEKKINFEALLKAVDKSADKSKGAAKPAPADVPKAKPAIQAALPTPPAAPNAGGREKEHIRILTDRA